MHEEEEADELYRDVDINQGRGLQVSQDIEDSHVTLTLVHSDGQQESSSTSSFVTSLLNPIIDPGVESIFTTASSSVAPLPLPTSTITPSIMTTTTTASQPPIPPTPILKAISNISGIVHQYMHQEMTEAIREAVQIQSSHSSRTSYAVAADLSEMELKKILIDKMEGNKSIQQSDEQRNLYKALVEAYEADKTILGSYGESAILKRRREDDDDQEGPSAGSDRGSTTGTQSRQLSVSEFALAEEPHSEWFSKPRKPPTPDRDWNKTLPAVQGNAQSWISKLAKQADARSSFNELLDTPIDFSNFIMNRLGVDTLTPELLAGPTYELMRGSCNSLTELEYHLEEVYKATTDQFDWVNPEGQQYPHNLLQPFPLIPDNRGRRVIPFEHFINNDLKYLQGGKLSNLTVEERFAFNVSLRMFTRSIVIQRRVEDLQLGNKDKKNMLMWIDELHKFSDGTLNDVRNALDDRLKGIRMQYLPTTIWRKRDKDRAAAMIQAIDKMLKRRRIMRSLERFVGGRQYEGDFRMLQKTI
nr:hypothetical protein [Tanacetum cinerariifolium]